MLKWDKPEVIEGLTTYRDDKDRKMFYVLPSQPRFRIDAEGNPMIKFLKYRMPIDREDGKKGGGFLIFDVEFAVPKDKLDAIKVVLNERVKKSWKKRNRSGQAPPAKIGELNFLRGAANLQFLDSGGTLVEKVQNPGSPSLYGNMVTPFTVELSPEGATLAEQALQGRGGVVQVAYDLWLPVKLPSVVVKAWFHAKKYMHFHQEVDVEERFWSEDDYKETVRETFTQSEAGGVKINPGTVTDQKALGAIRDWAWDSLEDAVARMVLGEPAAQDPARAQKLYTEQDIENVSIDVISNRVANYSRTYREGQVMEWNPAPRGTLPNITTLKGGDGSPLKWEDFAKTVDLDDPFFRQLNVNIRANADFDTLPLDSVEVKLEYKQGVEHRTEEFSLRSAADIGKFASFIDNDSYEYNYSFQVNYKNSTRRFDSPVMTSDETALTVNVGDTGILLVNIAPGDLNFDQVRQAQVTLQYEDAANDIPLMEHVFQMTAEANTHRWVETIFQAREKPVRYKVKYFMADGREFVVDWQETFSSDIFINDPFAATKTVALRGFGDFENHIDVIFVDLKYTDETNDYSQSKSLALSKTSTFENWDFPVIDVDGGIVTYSANIRFKDGTIEEIATTTADSDTIMLGDVALEQEIMVLADMVPFPTVKLVRVSLNYIDTENDIDETGDIIFRDGSIAPQTWNFTFEDKTRREYTWTATYFMTDGSSKTTGKVTTKNETIVLPAKPEEQGGTG